MALRANRQSTHLHLISSNDDIAPRSTNTALRVCSVRRAFPLLVDSVPVDDPFDSLTDAPHGGGA